MELSCEETFRRFQDYLDRELSSEEAALVKHHLDECGICSEEYVFEEAVLKRVRRLFSETEVPPDLFSRISDSLDQINT
jgi:anti-sigma factor (TIGR02949 family)